MRHHVATVSALALASGSMLGCAGEPPPTAGPIALATAAVSPGIPTAAPAAPVRFVALGDSYTIGTSVSESERWPNQLVEALDGGPALDLLANLAVNGATSDDVISRQLPSLDALRPDFVSLLVGVNDVVRGVPTARYAGNVATILDALLGVVPATRIVVVSTPDYTRTPRGADFGDPAQQRAAIGEVNAIAAALAADRGVAFVDISDIADRAAEEPSLVASDGLHPSGRQYELWVERIMPVVARLLAP